MLCVGNSRGPYCAKAVNEVGGRVEYLWNYFVCEFVRSFVECGTFEFLSRRKWINMEKDILLSIAVCNIKIDVLIDDEKDTMFFEKAVVAE